MIHVCTSCAFRVGFAAMALCMLSGCVSQGTFDTHCAERKEKEKQLESQINAIDNKMKGIENRLTALEGIEHRLTALEATVSKDVAALQKQLENAWLAALCPASAWQFELKVTKGEFAGLATGRTAHVRLYSPLLLAGQNVVVNDCKGKPQEFMVSQQSWTLKLVADPSKSWPLQRVLLGEQKCDVQGEISVAGANSPTPAKQKVSMSLGLTANARGLEMRGAIGVEEGSPYSLEVHGVWPAQ